MEDVVAGVQQGRTLFRAGRFTAAEATWRQCLREAFAQGDYAAMFVLSKNLGDVCASRDEALAFYEYALEVATTSRVLRDPSLRPYIATVAVAVERLDESVATCTNCGAGDVRVIQPLCQDDAPIGIDSALCFMCYENLQAQQTRATSPSTSSLTMCATCGVLFPPQSLKEDVDDLLYCLPCFDAYYADAGDDPEWGVEGDEEYAESEADDGMLCAGCLDADGTLSGNNGLVYCDNCYNATFTYESPSKSATTASLAAVAEYAPGTPVPSPATASVASVAEGSTTTAATTTPPPVAAPASLASSKDEPPESSRKKYSKEFMLSLRDSATIAPRDLEHLLRSLQGPPQQREKQRPHRPTAASATPGSAPRLDDTPTAPPQVSEHHTAMDKDVFARHVLGAGAATVAAVQALLVGSHRNSSGPPLTLQ
ncbi:hypothetical protein H310_02411 [Aphanomyces invadans]|uniref:Uncharacterized protein n=1 Tax=Aphanomyces invadans TaxID=157072 RepID=A0A024UP12_9STRA|nr:hypothetical protein H310_02411 [Aphanomyces invadans]ETW08039.1 hypothetical protein H310_02411 [Aphanomyces invadans]|eukprot:XP_008864132.1 hypothetical protein H310_02411 [Aphanomyces invadans]